MPRPPIPSVGLSTALPHSATVWQICCRSALTSVAGPSAGARSANSFALRAPHAGGS